MARDDFMHTCVIGVPDSDHPLRTDSAHCGGCHPWRRGASAVWDPNRVARWRDVPCDARDSQYGLCSMIWGHPGVLHAEIRDGKVWAAWRQVFADEGSPRGQR